MIRIHVDDVGYQDLSEISEIELKIFGKDAFDKNLLRKLIRRNLFFFKLEKTENKKDLIGFIIVVKDQEDRTNIINFAIKPKYQHQGFGSILLGKTIDRIKEMNLKRITIKSIVLNVKTNNENAINLYKKFNFKIVERIENYYQSGDDSYFMELIL